MSTSVCSLSTTVTGVVFLTNLHILRRLLVTVYLSSMTHSVRTRRPSVSVCKSQPVSFIYTHAHIYRYIHVCTSCMTYTYVSLHLCAYVRVCVVVMCVCVCVYNIYRDIHIYLYTACVIRPDWKNLYCANNIFTARVRDLQGDHFSFWFHEKCRPHVIAVNFF